MSTGEPDARLRRIVQVSGPPLLSGPSTLLLDDKIDLLKAGLRNWVLFLNKLSGYGSQIRPWNTFLCILSIAGTSQVNVPEFLTKICFETSVGEPEPRAKEPKLNCLLHLQFVISAPIPAPTHFFLAKT
jgi:hypothetical protein